MFDSVLTGGNVPKSKFGVGAIVSVIVMSVVIVVCIVMI